MKDTMISVDDILDELQLKKSRQSSIDPMSDMQRVNDMVEQILTEKKNKQLERDNIKLTPKELESLEKEIKAQTKSITRQYEKTLRESSKQVKRQQQEEKIIEKELALSREDIKAFENAISKQNNTHSIKISNVANDQKVKLQKAPQSDIVNEEKIEKIDSLKNSANTEHIKREMHNITSHFGTFKMSQTQIDSQISKTPINPYNYRELKKNRNKKIDNFVLGPNENKISQTDEVLVQKEEQNSADAVLAKLSEHEEKQQTNQNTKQLFNYEDEFDDDNQDEFEYTQIGQEDEIEKELIRKQKSIKVSMYGLGILSISAIILALVTVSNGLLMFVGKIKIDPMIYVEVNMILLIIGVVLSRKVFSNAVDGIINHTPHKDILYSVLIMVCFITNIMFLFSSNKLLENGIHLYTPIVLISLLFNFKSKYYGINNIVNNFRFISSNKDKYSAVIINDFKVSTDMAKGVVDGEPILVKNVKTDFCNDFIAHSFHHDFSDVICTKLAIWGLPIAIILSAIVFILSKDIFVSMTMLSGVTVMVTTFIGSLLVAFPLHDTSIITNHFAGMSPCVEAIDEFEETNSILVDACDLFPVETVVLHGIKTFSGKRIDDAIVDAASVVCQSKSILSNVFLNIIANNTELLKPVDSIIYEDLMGISAWVDNKRVLVGNRDLMINHSIAVPKQSYEDKYKEQGRELVYLSREGELCAAFVIQLTTKKEIFDVFNLLDRNDIKVIIKTVDSVLTNDTLSTLFKMERDMFKILPSRLHKSYNNEVKPANKNSTILANNGNVLGYIISVVATKKLSYCVKFGTVLNLICVILGVVSLGIMFFMDKLAMVNSLAVLIYMSVFGIIYWAHQKNVHL